VAGSEIWFYHLERSSVEDMLPPLLEKCMERGWRAVIRSKIATNLEAIDTRLWTYKPNTWLPHGKLSGVASEDNQQPILLVPEAKANADPVLSAQALFLLDGADWEGVSNTERIFVIFDGRDQDAVAHARNDWRRAREIGLIPAYWRQNEEGKWTRT
jgi:DNA polymerase III subunit chi